MAVYGFVVYYPSGRCDYVVALGDSPSDAQAAVAHKYAEREVEVAPLHLEDMLGDFFDSAAILTNEPSV